MRQINCFFDLFVLDRDWEKRELYNKNFKSKYINSYKKYNDNILTNKAFKILSNELTKIAWNLFWQALGN